MSQEESPSQSQEEGTFIIEDVLGWKIQPVELTASDGTPLLSKDGTPIMGEEVRYLVQWKGYGHDEDSWEPLECFNDCDTPVRLYNKWKDSFEGLIAKGNRTPLELHQIVDARNTIKMTRHKRAIAAAAAGTSTSPQQPQKRGPGRPRKHPLDDPLAPKQPKRKPGRPPKKRGASLAASDTSISGPPKKKKRDSLNSRMAELDAIDLANLPTRIQQELKWDEPLTDEHGRRIPIAAHNESLWTGPVARVRNRSRSKMGDDQSPPVETTEATESGSKANEEGDDETNREHRSLFFGDSDSDETGRRAHEQGSSTSEAVAAGDGAPGSSRASPATPQDGPDFSGPDAGPSTHAAHQASLPTHAGPTSASITGKLPGPGDSMVTSKTSATAGSKPHSLHAPKLERQPSGQGLLSRSQSPASFMSRQSSFDSAMGSAVGTGAPVKGRSMSPVATLNFPRPDVGPPSQSTSAALQANAGAAAASMQSTQRPGYHSEASNAPGQGQIRNATPSAMPNVTPSQAQQQHRLPTTQVAGDAFKHAAAAFNGASMPSGQSYANQSALAAPRQPTATHFGKPSNPIMQMAKIPRKTGPVNASTAQGVQNDAQAQREKEHLQEVETITVDPRRQARATG